MSQFGRRLLLAAGVCRRAARDRGRARRRAGRSRSTTRRRRSRACKPVQKGRSSAIYAADGSLIGFIRSNNIRQPVPASATSRRTSRTPRSRSRTSNFFNHGALDPAGIARAAWKDLLAGGKPVQGASTITQQLVRNLYIQNPEETIKRKLIEAHLADEEEEAHSKDWILTAYLNTAPYGTVEGETAVGAEAAAQTYFGKPAKDLTLTEAALIAGLPQAPSEYNPFLDPAGGARAPQRGAGGDGGAGLHRRAPNTAKRSHSGLGLNPGHKYQIIRDPFLFDLVQQELIDKLRDQHRPQRRAQGLHDDRPRRCRNAPQAAVDACGVCYSGGGPAAALASVDPKNGEIVALASTQDYSTESQFNYAWQAHRQPGSSFKTYVLDHRDQAGDRPLHHLLRRHLAEDAGAPRRRHLDRQQRRARRWGRCPLAEATWNSVNVVFAQLDLDVGPENVTHTAHQMGITAPLESVPAEAIGGLRVGVTPLEMADAYATLADGGIHHDADRGQQGRVPRTARSMKPTPNPATAC